MTERTHIITANWKMHKTLSEGMQFVREIAEHVPSGPKAPRVFIAAPFTAIEQLSSAAESTQLSIGAQNMHDASSGAFTGEIAAEMLVDAGAKFVILGHSERRTLFGETSSFINRKVHAALKAGLLPIVCVGETLKERSLGDEAAVAAVSAQLDETLAGIDLKKSKIVLAYEPIWAIGTGRTATPELANQMHKAIRAWVAKHADQKAADSIVIQYGGSVKPENAKELMDQPDIDGLLVGGASLSVDTFSKIVNYQNVGTPS